MKIPAATVLQPENGLEVLVRCAHEQGTSAVLAPELVAYGCDATTLRLGQFLLLRKLVVSSSDWAFCAGLAGEHQKLNANLALWLSHQWIERIRPDIWAQKVADPALAPERRDPQLPCPVDAVRSRVDQRDLDGLALCHWPGRAQVRSCRLAGA